MYTGITRGLFKVVKVDKKPGLMTYVVELNDALIAGLKVSDSVSIDGVCQTVVHIDGKKITFNAMEETLSKTTLNDLYEERMVGVERSARIGDENGGHDVAGHVFETGMVSDRKVSENNLSLEIKCSVQCIQFIFEKGFIAVDGSSLTVGEVDYDKGTFKIHLIPETLRLTNFEKKQLGDKVNIEVDSKAVIISKTIEKYISQMQTKLALLEERVERVEKKGKN